MISARKPGQARSNNRAPQVRRGSCGSPIQDSPGLAGGPVPGCSGGWPGGQCCRAWTWRPGDGGQCCGASAGSCPGSPATAARGGVSLGITLSRVASSARSAQFSFGRRGCSRCRRVSWWRGIKISAVFHVSSRRDSRSQAASRMVGRNTNCRHMIDDHHGWAAGRATLLVRAVDGILGTHTVSRDPFATLSSG